MTSHSKLKTLLIALFASSLLFVGLAALVMNGATDTFDVTILVWINQYANDTLNNLFIILTELGGAYFVGGLTSLLALYLIIKRKYYKAALLIVGVGGTALINMFIKTIFERPRPDLWERLITESSYSFPSGHSAASAALALSIILILWNTKWRLAAIITASLYVLTVGFSRMYLGVHFPSDVLGGWLIGTVWVSFVASYLHAIKKRHAIREKKL